MRRDFVSRIEAATKIQRFYRSFKCQKKFMCYKRAAIQIQRFVRDHITRRGLLGNLLPIFIILSYFNNFHKRLKENFFIICICK